MTKQGYFDSLRRVADNLKVAMPEHADDILKGIVDKMSTDEYFDKLKGAMGYETGESKTDENVGEGHTEDEHNVCHDDIYCNSDDCGTDSEDGGD